MLTQGSHSPAGPLRSVHLPESELLLYSVVDLGCPLPQPPVHTPEKKPSALAAGPLLASARLVGPARWAVLLGI